MVLQRRLDYGFSGYEAPVVPRAPRSARGKVPIRKACEDNPIRAFEILASVAGELLQETEISSPNAACGDDRINSIKREKEDKGKLLKTEPPVQETFEENSFTCVPGLQEHHQIYAVNQNASGSCFCTVAGDFPRSGEIFRGYVISAVETKREAELSVTQSRQLEKICFATKWPFADSRNASRGPSGKVGGDSPQSGEFFRRQVDSVIERKTVAKSSILRSITSGTHPVKGCLDTKELHWKPPALVSPESNSTASLFRGQQSCHPFSNFHANIVDSRDDDETLVRCTQPRTMATPYRPSPNAVDQTIRNLSVSGHWRAAPKMKDWKRKSVYCNGRPTYTRQISRRISPFKRRKLFNHIPPSISAGGFHYKGIFNSAYKSSNGDNCTAVKGASSSIAGQQVPSKTRSRDCNVKLSIKSLKVPELLIEIPATATVGSLKRTVVEAVTSILGDGLHVGVLLRGKTVRDDNKTLLQTGICHDDKHHRLGFMLEPNHPKITPPQCSEDSPLLSGGICKGLPGYTVSLPVQPAPSDVTLLPQVMNSGYSADNKFNAVHSLDDILIYNTMPDSRALVAVPAVSMEALAVVPFHQKPSPHEFVQRRTRRPFSVSEVEALVQAVEKLGTGRWRDVKFCAFDSAKHRTYVDLKDKWKTLVHTARISPQQRRGEPVPQQLLDRVLAAHAFWSQQQAKQPVKLEI